MSFVDSLICNVLGAHGLFFSSVQIIFTFVIVQMTLGMKPVRKSRFLGFVLVIIFVFSTKLNLLGQTRTWVGTTSSDWNTASNWSPSGVPTSGTVNINSSTAPFPCVLDADRTITALNISNNASLNFNGFNLVVTGTSTINNAQLFNTNLTSGSFSGFSNNVFHGSTQLIKTVNATNDLVGGNTFNGSLIVHNNSANQLRFSNTTGDTIHGSATYNKNGTGAIQIARNGNSFFNGNVTINNQTTGTIEFGGGVGTTDISSGHALLTDGFTTGTLTLRSVNQLGSTSNGVFNPATSTLFQCNFGGDLGVVATGDITINNSTFLLGLTVSALNVNLVGTNNLSTQGGVAAISKNGGTSNTWAGGNTFGNLILNNNSTQFIVLADVVGDTYHGDATFNKNGTGDLRIARNGVNIFSGALKLNANATGLVSLGLQDGITQILAGGSLQSDGFTASSLTLRRVSQNGDQPNGVFNPSNLTAFELSMGGSIAFQATNDVSVNNCIFSSSVELQAVNINLSGVNSFSSNTGVTTLTKLGGVDNNWPGGYTFGNLIVNNFSPNSSITLGSVLPDVYAGNSIFNNTSPIGGIHIAQSGVNHFSGNVTLNNSSSGIIQFCGNNGQAIIQAGYALLTDGFTNGTLTLRRVTQNGSATNGNFQPLNFNAVPNNNFGGNFSVICSGILTIQQSQFRGANTFTGSQVILNGANSLSTDFGTTVITKTGSSNNDWDGGNTFGPVVINNNGTGRLTIADVAGDVFTSTAVFNKNNVGSLQIARSGVNTFADNVTINNATSGEFSFGINNGTSIISNGSSILTSGFSDGNLIFRGITQNGNNSNGSFEPSNFTSAMNSVFEGDISIVASQSIILTNSSFRRNNVFTAPSINVTTACNFSTTIGTSIFTKTGTVNNDWNGGNSFGNVIFIMEATSGRLRLANNAADTYNGNVTFQRTAQGELQPAFNGNNVFFGDISTVGSTQPITFGQNTGRVVFQGSGAQSIFGDNSHKPLFRRMRFNKTANSVKLEVPVDVLIELELLSGKLITDEVNILSILNGVVVSGASGQSFVAGPVRKVGNETFIFPTGKSSKFAPIAISAPAVETDHFTAEYFDENPDVFSYATDALSVLIDSVSSCEFWILNRTNGNSNVLVSLNWEAERCGEISDLSNLTIANWNGNQWDNLGASSLAGDSIMGSLSTQNLVSDFGPFTIGVSNTGMPEVVLVSFSAHVSADNTVDLFWSTSREFLNDFFTVERSIDGISWEVLAQVASQGNSNQVSDYELNDPLPYSGISYYRMKQTFLNGEFQYFFPVSVFLEASSLDELVVFPNPAQELIRVYGPEAEIEALKLFDSSGSEITMVVVSEFSTSNQLAVNIANLSQGVYHFRGPSMSKRFIKY